jgi:hypothetical protein
MGAELSEQAPCSQQRARVDKRCPSRACGLPSVERFHAQRVQLVAGRWDQLEFCALAADERDLGALSA